MSRQTADGSVRAALELLAELPAAEDAGTLRRDAVRGVAVLLPADVVCWFDREPVSGNVAVESAPEDAVPPDAVRALASGMPADALRDRLGVRWEAGIDVPDPRTGARVAAYRFRRDFDEDERRLLVVLGGWLGVAQRLLWQRRRPPDRSLLTARETEVLELLSAGLTPRQAARLLRISPRTCTSTSSTCTASSASPTWGRDRPAGRPVTPGAAAAARE